jgi:hypothetical protein
MIKLFTEHPRSKGQGYFEHMFFALSISARLFLCCCMLIIHSIFPFLFGNTASNILAKLMNKLKINNTN